MCGVTSPTWRTCMQDPTYKYQISIDGEIWRDVPNFEDLYQISNLGRIRSKDRVRLQKHPSGKMVNHLYKGKILSIDYSTSRFGCLNVYDVENKCSLSVYDLVCQVYGQSYADMFFEMSYIESSPDEIWIDVPDYIGYSVSSKGRIRKSVNNHYILLHAWNMSGYDVIDMSKNNESSSYLVHRLVATAFLPNPENKPQVNHKDGNKKNNCIENLEWCTASENTQHAYDTGLIHIDIEQKIRCAKLGSDKIKVPVFCKELDRHFESLSEASKETGIDIARISVASLENKPVDNYTFERVVNL